MRDQSPQDIRPIWFVGGIAIGLLSLCALVGVATVAALLWLSPSRTPSVTPSPQVALERETTHTPPSDNTLVSPSITPRTETLPTLLPVPGTAVNAPTTVLSPSQNTGPRPVPEEAVRAYFNLVSEQRYDLTWPMLTDVFKQKYNCCSPNYNYAGYVEWWNSVDRVDIGNMRTVSQSGDQAVVYAELLYYMTNGTGPASDNTPYIALIYDAAMGSWRIDDKRANP